MLEKLKNEVYNANLDLVKNGLVIQTWGNVSGRDNESGLVVIKPSGISYNTMRPEDMVVLDQDGKVIEGRLKPSTDSPTHLFLYNSFPAIGGIVHTHSAYATAWAQAGKDIPPFGTTHADYYFGKVPCSRKLSEDEVRDNYELNTGKVIVETLGKIDPLVIPSVLINGHGPFCWGLDPEGGVHIAVTLEEIARIAFYTVLLGHTAPVDQHLLDKHYLRKHGTNAYYGQKKNGKS
jgi:L-ribulose-5-phosphate 4-epimerase